MIALRHWLGKTGAPSFTYDNKCCAAVRSENAKLRELALDLEARLATVLSTSSNTDAKLQRALDENALQQMLIEQLQAQLVTRSNLVTAAAVAHPADYTALQKRVSQLEAKLADTQDQLAKKVEELGKSKAHVIALQQQRGQLVLELEQVEDGFQAEVEKLHGDLQSWKADFNVVSSENGSVRGAPTMTCPLPPPKYTEPHFTRGTRASSVTSDSPSAGALFEASLERTKATTRIWALEDEVERVRTERDSLRRRLGAGRASLIQLKRQASEVEQLDKSKAHITALQQQREQLVVELEQVEDGFQAEVEKLHGDLENWKLDLSVDSSEDGTVRGPTPCPLPPPKYSEPYLPRETRAPSVISTDAPSAGALFEASLERTKAATRIWALEDEVERVRSERDSLRRRLGAGRASLIQLKQQASEVRMSGGKGPILVNLGRGLKSESQLISARKPGRKGSSMQLNTLVRLPFHGEPLTPETSDDNASLEMKM
ncbi:unnamed protein product [Rhizoctonia solani]|uniref:Uncharacterized protein n=1 Tax=Rhizoctonia solani TaxID=456999 RepID=A0A8H3BPC5_9AGAM|nr:unnamed protein product [Rhizoctonia solani]